MADDSHYALVNEILQGLRHRPHLVRLFELLMEQLAYVSESECEKAIGWVGFIRESPELAGLLYQMTLVVRLGADTSGMTMTSARAPRN